MSVTARESAGIVRHRRELTSAVLSGAPDGNAATPFVTWIELAPTARDPEAVFEELSPLCGPELTREMVADLVEPDPLPEMEPLSATVRKVSAFDVTVTRDGLRFHPIEIVANGSWLVSQWQRCEAHGLGWSKAQTSPAETHEDVLDAVLERWDEGKGSTPGDLGVALLHALSLNYSRARKWLWDTLDDWERDFYCAGDDADITALSERLTELHRVQGEFKRRVSGLNLPRERVRQGWFSGVTMTEVADRTDELIDRSLTNLREFGEALRSAFALTQSRSTLKQLEIAESQKSASEKFQHKIELITATLLVPTLIAGFFGANTWLPGGQNGRHDGKLGFEIMIVLMFAGASLAYAAIKWFREEDWAVNVTVSRWVRRLGGERRRREPIS